MENLESSNLMGICAITLLALKNQRNRCPSTAYTSPNSHVK